MMFPRRRQITKPNCMIMWSANGMLASIFLSYALFLCFSYPFCSARDTITEDSPLKDDGSESLVSAGGIFELGFFSLNGTGSSGSNRRYVGIWYHKLTSKTVVWVANRDKPLLADHTGVLGIRNGTLQVSDTTSGKSLWSAEFKDDGNSAFNRTVKLKDDGNLVLSDTDRWLTSVLWQSFKSPTDTFIPGMIMDKSLNLTSRNDKDDPGTGKFTFKLDQGGYQFIILKESAPYWRSGRGSAEMLREVAYLLSNFSRTNTIVPRLDYSYRRLVIESTGGLQFSTWNEDKKQWLLSWVEPKDQCSVLNSCGNFGSCNVNNTPLVCKCLPGFEPQSLQKWDWANFSGGCVRKSTICGNNDTFLKFRMKKAGEADLLIPINEETECRKTCLRDCKCQAYSHAPNVSSPARRDKQSINDLCYLWTKELNNLVEEEDMSSGFNLSVRVASSDLASTVRDCKPCGTTMIPYPLSTNATSCGDPMYHRFRCNNYTGQLDFEGPNDSLFRVINILQSAQEFSIHSTNVDNCDSRDRVLNITFPFKVINWCSSYPGNLNSEVNSSSHPVVIEIGWGLPLEPTCSTLKECTGWPHTTCKQATDGKKRCLCNENFRWSGINLNCTQEGNLQELPTPVTPPSRKNMSLSLVVVTVLISGIFLAFILICFYIWRRKMTRRQDQISRPLDSERRVRELMDTSDFKKEDEKGIDVPFFSLQSILEATDNFSLTNKLGQGGYGPVYKGIFPGGEEIAVKRLSRVSGQGLQEFRNEVVLIAKLQHRNLVRLRGYCMKGEEKILLYEYMPNKSLDSFIFDHAQNMFINWEMRFNIILGIGRGLLYLHQDSRLRIIHRDLKTSNILLDEEMNPKISDFGLARIVGGKETQSNTNTVVGTYGYMSPEYALDGTFSVKSDVFSFGVVLLEIISGKKNTGFYQSKQTFSLLGYAWGLWTENKVLDLMDMDLHESCNKDQFFKCVNIGLLCVQEDPSDRPTMSNVVAMLDSETAILPVPKQPAFLIRRGNSSTASSSTKPDTQNEITNTLDEGR